MSFKKTKRSILPIVDPNKKMLSIKEAAAYSGASIWCVRTWAWEKRVPYVQFAGRKILFDRADIDAFINAIKIVAS